MISPEHEDQELHVCVQVLEHQHGGRKGPPIGQALTGLIKLSNTVLPAMSPAQACSHRCLFISFFLCPVPGLTLVQIRCPMCFCFIGKL